MFNLIKSSNYDSNKKDLIFIDCKHRINKSKLYITKYFLNIAKILSKDFNIYVFNITNNIKNINSIKDLYPEFNYVLIDSKKVEFEKIKNNPNAKKDNENKLINDYFIPGLNFLNDVKGLFICPSVLLSSDMNNEKFDSLKDNDEKAINEIKMNIKSIKDKKMWTYTAFMYRDTRIANDLLIYLFNKYNCKGYQFIIDPSQFYHYFDKEFNSITYNFENDFRGTRNLYKFPMGELMYIYNYEINNLKEFEDKENNFIWGGNVLVFKGDRMKSWLPRPPNILVIIFIFLQPHA